MNTGWTKISGACDYASVEKRTVRSWLKSGLKHSRLPSGMILIKLSDVDEYLGRFAITENVEQEKIDNIVEDTLKEMRA